MPYRKGSSLQTTEMVDYIEPILVIKQRIKAVEDALRAGRHREARLILADVSLNAAQLDAQIVKQFKRELGLA